MITRIPYHKITEADKIYESLKKFAGRSVTAKQVASHLRKLTNNSVIITTAKNTQVDENTITLNAFYDPDEDSQNERPYEIVIVFPESQNQVTMPIDEWRNFSASVIDLLEHEMIHSAQYRARNFKPQRRTEVKNLSYSQKYLSNPDEIEAYAYMLSKELIRKTKNFDQCFRLLRHFINTSLTKDQAGRLLSPTLYGFLKEFNFDSKNPVVKQLIKKTVSYVQQFKKQTERDSRKKERNEQIIKDTERFLEEKKKIEEDKKTYYTIVSSS